MNDHLHLLFQQILKPFSPRPSMGTAELAEAVAPLIFRSREIAECSNDIGAGQISVYDPFYSAMVTQAEDALHHCGVKLTKEPAA